MGVAQRVASWLSTRTGVILVTVLATLVLQSLGLFSRIELASLDHRVGVFRSEQSINENVVVILVDESSLQAMTAEYGRWPWPRAVWADLLEYFVLAGAQGVAFDLLFSEQQDIDIVGGNDDKLAAATRASGFAVHAMQLLRGHPDDTRTALPQDFAQRFAFQAEVSAADQYSDYLAPIAPLYRAARGVGFVNVEPDRDGVYRRIRLFNRYDEEWVLPSLASALLLPLFESGQTVRMTSGRADFGHLQIPLDGSANYLINPYGQLRSYSAASIIQSLHQIRNGATDATTLDPAIFGGKLILVGASAVGLQDVKART